MAKCEGAVGCFCVNAKWEYMHVMVPHGVGRSGTKNMVTTTHTPFVA